MRFAATLCLVCTALCGCVDTVFESLPGKNISQCDQRFAGKWRLSNSKKDVEGDKNLFVVIVPDCKAMHFLEHGKDDTGTDTKTHIAFASIGTKSILAVKFDENDTHTNKTDWSNGYHYFLYDIHKGEIRLRGVDDVQVAHLIIDGKVQGRTEKISKRPGGRTEGDGLTLHNYVAGNAEAMA